MPEDCGCGAKPKEALWKDEFPVKKADERYVGRRQMAKFLTLGSLGMFAGNLWIWAKGWFQSSEAFPEKVVANVSGIPVKGVKLFEYPRKGDQCILIRTAEEGFVAYSQKCTHLSCAVYYAPEKDRLECPCHQGYFSIHDGSVLQGPPERPLPRVVLNRRGDELIATRMEMGS
jgi:Rieske Fe-S protein